MKASYLPLADNEGAFYIKEKLKSLGGIWDPALRLWCVPKRNIEEAKTLHEGVKIGIVSERSRIQALINARISKPNNDSGDRTWWNKFATIIVPVSRPKSTKQEAEEYPYDESDRDSRYGDIDGDEYSWEAIYGW